MKRLHEGLDYLLYRFYVFGGFAALVAYFALVIILTEFAGVVDLSDRALLAICMAPVTLWILGILAYWWWVFLFKGRREAEEMARQQPQGTPGIEALKSWSRLNGAMAIHGGDREALRRMERAARRPVVIWYGMQNLLVLWILGSFWLWLAFEDQLPTDYLQTVMAPGVIAIMVLFLVVTPFLLGRALKGGEAAYLAPLGLAGTGSTPEAPHTPGVGGRERTLARQGAIFLEGSRHGRTVRVETLGRHSVTSVRVETSPFEIQSQDGKLVACRDAPEAVTVALKGLRKAKRWRGVSVSGGAGGIRAERESRGENMWLYDLWLIERLAEQLH